MTRAGCVGWLLSGHVYFRIGIADRKIEAGSTNADYMFPDNDLFYLNPYLYETIKRDEALGELVLRRSTGFLIRTPPTQFLLGVLYHINVHPNFPSGGGIVRPHPP